MLSKYVFLQGVSKRLRSMGYPMPLAHWITWCIEVLLQQGWSFAHGTWRFHGFSFTLGQCCNSADWGLISHWIRDSIRRKHFEQLFSSKRHEMVGQNIPCYTADRMALVRKWIKGDSVAVLLATGSIAFAASRFKGQPEADVKCPKCKSSNVNWHHYWECWLGLVPPTDLLFRRFLCPRAEYDMEICNTFKM